MLQGFVDTLRKERDVIRGAPWSFAGVCVAALIFAFGLSALFFGEEIKKRDSAIASVEKDRDLWKDIAQSKSPPARPEAPASDKAPKTPPIRIVTTPSPPQRVAPAPVAAGRDSYTNSGVNNGIVGPVTVGKPEFVLTDDLIAAVINACPPDKPVALHVIGMNERAERAGEKLRLALEGAGRKVTVTSIGMVSPPNDRPIVIHRNADQTIVSLDPKA